MRKTSLDCVFELAKKDKRVLFIGSDLGPGVLENFKTHVCFRHLCFKICNWPQLSSGDQNGQDLVGAEDVTV